MLPLIPRVAASGVLLVWFISHTSAPVLLLHSAIPGNYGAFISVGCNAAPINVLWSLLPCGAYLVYHLWSTVRNRSQSFQLQRLVDEERPGGLLRHGSGPGFISNGQSCSRPLAEFSHRSKVRHVQDPCDFLEGSSFVLVFFVCVTKNLTSPPKNSPQLTTPRRSLFSSNLFAQGNGHGKRQMKHF